MFPFDLPGPQFLALYAAFAALIALISWVARARLEDGPPVRVDAVDPYAMAYLRGGIRRALLAACASLTARKLLTIEPPRRKGVPPIVRAVEGASERVTHAFERSILELAFDSVRVDKLAADAKGSQGAREMVERLQELGLLAGLDVLRARLLRLLIALAALWSVGGYKFLLAISRGHHNVVGLFAVAVAGSIAIAIIVMRPRTPRGDRLLSHAEVLFAGLPSRTSTAPTLDTGYELPLLAALFGAAAVPLAALPERDLFAPRHWRGIHVSTGGGCDSTAASACSSSCGSSCGGGCGGCGS
jgi:uncharacterized protein (TIGR04222 family)